jgi:hypothetical protein
MEVKEGKWRTRGGEVVTVSRGGNDRYPWKCVHSTEKFVLVTDNGRANLTYGENVHDLIAPVHEITPGSYWRLRHGEAKWFVVGKSRYGNWCLESESGGVIFSPEDAFLAPWTDPPKPRTWKVYVFATAKTSDHTRMQAYFLKEEAESSYDRISNVVEVTLTEEVGGV